MKTIITKVENNRVIKHLPIDDELADGKLAELIVTYPNAFIYDGEYAPSLWVEDGEVFTVPVAESNESIIARLESVIDEHLDKESKSLRYESIKTIVTYRDDPNPKFKAEGIAGYQLRSECYTLGIQLIEEVTNGTRPVPTEEELIALLPKITYFLQYE